MSKTIQQLAQEAHDSFTTDTRNDGTEYWHRKDDAPDWVTELCRIAHGDMFPDDWRYEFIVQVSLSLADASDPDAVEPEPDTSTHDLTGWLHSRADRTYYLTEALDNGGITDGFQLLAVAQNYEIIEVLYAVRDFLSDMADESDDDSDEATA